MVCAASEKVSRKQLSGAHPPARRQKPVVLRHCDGGPIFHIEPVPVRYAFQERSRTADWYRAIMSQSENGDGLASFGKFLYRSLYPRCRVEDSSPWGNASPACH